MLRRLTGSVLRNDREIPGHKLDRPAYCYQQILPQNGDSLTTRILTLHPGNRQDPLRGVLDMLTIGAGGSSVDYEALSYHWGSPALSAAIYMGDEEAELLITESLKKALVGLRSQTSTRKLWVDAVCIHQKNIDERTNQVRQMHRVYQSAYNVIIWLCRPLDHSRGWDPALAFRLIHRYHELAIRQPDLDVQKLSWSGRISWLRSHGILPPITHQGVISDLFHCTWFERAWVVQEISCSRKATIVCDDGSGIDYDHFAIGLKFAVEKQILAADSPSGFASIDRGYRKPGNWSSALQMYAIKSQDPSTSKGLLEYLQRFAGSQCSDPRDKLFSLYGISELPAQAELKTYFEASGLVPDYRKDVTEVYTAAARACLTTGSLDILSQPCLRPNRHPGLPSWVADWSAFKGSESLGSLAATGKYNASKDSLASVRLPSPERCEIEALTFGTIEDVVTDLRLRSIVINLPYASQPLHLTLVHGKWTQSLKDWTKKHFEDAGYHTGEGLQDVGWACFSAIRLAYESQWFRTSLQTRNYRTDDEVRDVIRRYIEVVSQANGVVTYLKLKRVAKIFMMGIKLIRAVRDGPYDEQIARERTIIVTDNGYVGIGPFNTSKGDRVVLAKGSKVPLVLRRRTTEAAEELCELVGDAYLHGIMQGEAFDETKCSPVALA